MLRQFVQGAAIAESAGGLVPQRMNFPQGAPAAALLRRSEQLVWLFDDVECCLGQLPPEPSPTITGVAAPGRDLPYYRSQSFVDRPAPDQGWESVARGQLAVASEHLHFRGPGLSIRLAYGSVLNWKPYHDSIGAVPRVSTAWWFSATATAGSSTTCPATWPPRRPRPCSAPTAPESRNRSDRPMTTGESGGDR